jgi:hypothetical protein
MVGGSDKPLSGAGPAGDVKSETQGWDPKVPIQAVVTLAVSALAYFGVELEPEVSAAIGVLLGILAARFGPAPDTKLVPK